MHSKKYVIATGTVTYAIKGRDILRRNGFAAKIERKSSNAGCGYTVVTSGNIDKARMLLENSGVKILSVSEESDI